MYQSPCNTAHVPHSSSSKLWQRITNLLLLTQTSTLVQSVKQNTFIRDKTLSQCHYTVLAQLFPRTWVNFLKLTDARTCYIREEVRKNHKRGFERAMKCAFFLIPSISGVCSHQFSSNCASFSYDSIVLNHIHYVLRSSFSNAQQ